jgi:hypothetical protein
MPPMLAPTLMPALAAVESDSIRILVGFGTAEDVAAAGLVVVIDSAAIDVEESGEADDREFELELDSWNVNVIVTVTEGSELSVGTASVGAAADVGKGRTEIDASTGTEFCCA